MKLVTALRLALFLFPVLVRAQDTTDTIRQETLEGVTIKAYRVQMEPVRRLPDVHGTYLLGGKKTEMIKIADLPVNLAERTGRQLFAKIPGAFVYDMDGSGNQLNLATRGLDPHRSWEFNVRQNGVLINSDLYGYPASHYNPPMEAIQRMELVRGTASLQYGAHFGGMINFVVKEPDTTRPVSFESINTVGSFGQFSSYNALGGRQGKFSYYAYYYRRTADGYRENSRSESEAQYISLRYALAPGAQLRAELGRSTYLYQIPGPLTDSMFYADPRQSTRTRNFYSPDIYVPSLTFDWTIDEQTTLQWVASGIFGRRNSVMFIGFADRPDTFDPLSGQFASRQVDIDGFNSYTTELRLLRRHHLGSMEGALASGIRYINNDLQRRQIGRGTRGNDYDLTLIEPGFGRDLNYRTQNIAIFLEYMLNLAPGLSLSPGFRYEYGRTRMLGTISYLAPERVPLQIDHNFPLLGVNLQYESPWGTRFYAGWSQGYRPVIFADVIPPTPLDRTDPNLKNALGYNAEAGLSGAVGAWLNYDLTYFHLRYNNRIGSQILRDEQGQSFIYKTNLGDTRTDGLELYLELKPLQLRRFYLSLFTATAWMEGVYLKGSVVSGAETRSLDGKRLESAPRWTSRNGLNISYGPMAAALQYSYVDATFSDAFNTVEPTANGGRGLVPGYGLWDFNASCRFGGNFMLRAGVNNFLDRQYFTKRPVIYPGPGVWPSDGRSFFASLAVQL